MAITIREHTDSPGIGNSNIVHAVTSNSSSNAQYRYVADINDKDDNLLQRIKQQPNPNDTGVFDFGNIVTNYLGPTDDVWDIGVVANNENCGKEFKIRFGEEWSTSTTGSVTLYVGNEDIAGAPSVSGSDYLFLLDGVLNPNQLDDWQWQSSTKYDEEDATDDVTFTHQNGLTNFATQSIRLEDFHTISFLNGNLGGNADDATNAQDVFAVTCKQYNSAGTEISSSIIYNLAGPRTSSPTTTFWGSVYNSQDETTRLVHFPAGPANFAGAGLDITGSCAYYDLIFTAQATDGLPNESGIFGQYRFNITDKNCGYDGVRFAWRNEYGVWDYFTFGLAESTTSAIERESFEKSFVNYSATNAPGYDRSNRGEQQYQNKVTKTHTAQSDYLTQVDADNLRELFFSTNVYVQVYDEQVDANKWWPVVIENASVTEKTNPRSQKLFTYTVNYRYANGERARV